MIDLEYLRKFIRAKDRGSNIRDIHVRGSQVIDATTPYAIERLKQYTQPGQITIGNVPIPFDDEQQHMIFAGAPGTGKSVAIKHILATIRERGQRALVHDPVGDLVEIFYRPDRDFILNPLDARHSTWYPWADMDRHDLPAVCKTLVPDAQGQADPFWNNAAQAVLRALFLKTQSMDELLTYALVESDDKLLELVKSAGLAGLVGTDKTFSSVRATLAAQAQKLTILPNVTLDDYRNGKCFSIKKWVESNDGSDDSWVFLTSDKSQADALSLLTAWWVSTVIRVSLSLEPDRSRSRRLWLVLDELPALGKQEQLAPAMAEGRKFGLSVILGVQSIQQLRHIYGKEMAQVLWGLPKTRLSLRISDQETAEIVAKEVGEYQRRRISTSFSEGHNYGESSGTSSAPGHGSNSSTSHGHQQGQSTQEQLVIEQSVLTSEVLNLPDLMGYLRADGDIAKVKLNYRNYEKNQPGKIFKPPRVFP